MENTTKTVLYIEDDAANRVLVRKILQSADYDVLLAEDGISGIDIAREKQPDLILLDMNMPGLDGYEVSTRIKASEHLKNVPVVAVTANVLNGDRERSLIAGCDGFIGKPIDPDGFISEVEGYLGGRREKVAEDEKALLLREYSNKVVSRLEDKMRELSVSLEETKQAERIKSEFLSMMSHELRTPLNSILNYPLMLLEECADVLSDSHKEWLMNIHQSGEAMSIVVTSVFDFIHLEKSLSVAPLEPVFIYDLAQASLQYYRNEAEEKSLTLKSLVTPEIPLIYANSQNLQTVLFALLSNAIKFTNEGEVCIKCKLFDPGCDEVPENVSDYVDVHSSYILLTVLDTGIGIAKDKFEEVFGAFVQLEETLMRQHGGIGMGLTMARRIIEHYHGAIWLESDPGKGTQVYVLLPVNHPSNQDSLTNA